MFFGFNRQRQRQPAEIVRLLKDLLVRLWELPANPKVGSPESLIYGWTLAKLPTTARRGSYEADMSLEGDCPGGAR